LSVWAESGKKATAEDVLVGDVFLCSGQSNMVLQVHRTLNSRAEIAGAANEDLRMLAVPPATSFSPLEEFTDPVEWQVAAPDTVPDWSATCYYFARELQKTVEVPIGMVAASLGGSNIRAWMSKAALQSVGDYDGELQILDLYVTDRSAGLQRWGAVWEDWWRSRSTGHDRFEPWSETGFDDREWTVAPDGLGAWENWGVASLAEFDGMIWYRTTLRLNAEQASQPAVISLGKIDEIDQTWINGQPVGNTSGPATDRFYRLPAKLLHEGENVIVVNVLDTYGSGGLFGEADARALLLSGGTEVRLDGQWHYQVVPLVVGWPPRAPWDPIGGMTVRFNAMIAPIGPYEFRGCVWYQGESNTGEPERYEGLLSGLMAAWRDQFGENLPFLIVQLANYGDPPAAPVESGWARLREAQRRVVAQDQHAGLAVTIDIGDRYDIHPANKQEVGRRLARAARRVIYGEPIAPSGPVGNRARVEKGQVVIEFGDLEGELLAYGAESPIGFELCGAAPDSCRYARARIDGGRVLLRVPQSTTPERVRFCWADSPVCTLYDDTGLPAGPFELQLE